MDPVGESGRYEMVLEGRDVIRLAGPESEGPIAADILIMADRAPLETAELTMDRELLDKVATLSGGAVVAPEDAKVLVDRFGPGSRIVEETQNITLWDSGWLLALLTALLATEWLLRRWAGLS